MEECCGKEECKPEENVCVDNEECCEEMSCQDKAIIESKQLRVELDHILQRMKTSPRQSRSRSLSMTHLEDAILRLGMDLKELDTPNPYPNSYDPSNTTVDPTADGLKL